MTTRNDLDRTLTFGLGSASVSLRVELISGFCLLQYRHHRVVTSNICDIIQCNTTRDAEIPTLHISFFLKKSEEFSPFFKFVS
jgi:hypothetical protein